MFSIEKYSKYSKSYHVLTLKQCRFSIDKRPNLSCLFQVDIPDNSKVGTRRYLAPELLDESIDPNQVKNDLDILNVRLG